MLTLQGKKREERSYLLSPWSNYFIIHPLTLSPGSHNRQQSETAQACGFWSIKGEKGTNYRAAAESPEDVEALRGIWRGRIILQNLADIKYGDNLKLATVYMHDIKIRSPEYTVSSVSYGFFQQTFFKVTVKDIRFQYFEDGIY